QRNKETFLVHNWFFKRGFTIVIIIIAIIFFYNHYKHHDNSIENFTLLFAIQFFMANIFQSFFVARRVVIHSNLLQLSLRIIMLLLTIVFMSLY
ncbi:multidrug transporter, partial [Francisella tularensis subsp. holarctica]|nr:multidrug transporter [Francisella tularensis subsp. holarctica]